MALFRRRTNVVLAAVLAAACTGSRPTVNASDALNDASGAPSISVRVAFAPRNARLVGTIRAPFPGDGIFRFKPILLAAYDKACRDVLNVQSEIRQTRKGTVVVVSCNGHATRAVRVIYVGVIVPKLVGFSAHGLEDVAAMLGLRIKVSSRLPRPGEQQGIVISQRPSAGAVVPSGTRITAVCTCLLNP